MMINSYSTNQGISTPKKQISKLLLCVFLSFNFFFGFDFGFTAWIQNRKFRFSVKLCKNISAVFCASVLIVGITTSEIEYNFWYCFNLLHYLMCFFVVSATKYNLYSFSQDLCGLCNNCTVIRKDRLVAVVVTCFLLGSGIKIMAFVAECYVYGDMYVIDCKMGKVPLYLYILPCLGVDVIPLVLITSYYYVNTFITCLKEAYCKSEISLDYLEKNYTAIMDCFDKIKPLYGNLVSIYILHLSIITTT